MMKLADVPVKCSTKLNIHPDDHNQRATAEIREIKPRQTQSSWVNWRDHKEGHETRKHVCHYECSTEMNQHDGK